MLWYILMYDYDNLQQKKKKTMNLTFIEQYLNFYIPI